MGRGVAWDDAAHTKLLLAIIREVKFPSAMYDAVAARMGNGMTSNAIRCHVRDLKKRAGINETPANSVPTTPRKPIKAANASAGNTPSRSLPPRKRAKPINESDTEIDDNNLEVQATPVPKKVRRESSVQQQQATGDEIDRSEDTA